jgi:hypothetical protein
VTLARACAREGGWVGEWGDFFFLGAGYGPAGMSKVALRFCNRAGRNITEQVHMLTEYAKWWGVIGGGWGIGFGF